MAVPRVKFGVTVTDIKLQSNTSQGHVLDCTAYWDSPSTTQRKQGRYHKGNVEKNVFLQRQFILKSLDDETLANLSLVTVSTLEHAVTLTSILDVL